MPRDYSWSRNSIPPRLNTIGELSGLLGLGRHQTRRRLVASGLPFRVYVRRWKDPNSGKWFSRRAIGIPQKTAAELIKQDMVISVGTYWKSFCRQIKSKNSEIPSILRDLIRSIGDIETDQPPVPLVGPRIRDFSTKTPYYSGASTLKKTLRHAQKIKIRKPKITLRNLKIPKAVGNK